MEELNVLYTINQKYVDICLTSLLSIIKNSGIPYIHCHIITSGFQKEDYQKLNQFIAKHQNVEIKCYPLENFNIEQFNIPNCRGTQIPNARLFFQEIMNQEISKIKQLLYLDADTLTISDLTKLKEFQNRLCAVKDLAILKKRKNEMGLENYFNSGVLWFNIDDWVKQNCQDRLIRFIENNKAPLPCPDQDILNYTFDGKIMSLPMNFNMSDASYVYKGLKEKLYFYSTGISIKEVHKEKENAAIIHSYGLGVKPWVSGNLSPFHDIFMNLMKEIDLHFEPNELTNLQKMFNSHSNLYYEFLLISRYTPRRIKKLAKRILIK